MNLILVLCWTCQTSFLKRSMGVTTLSQLAFTGFARNTFWSTLLWFGGVTTNTPCASMLGQHQRNNAWEGKWRAYCSIALAVHGYQPYHGKKRQLTWRVCGRLLARRAGENMLTKFITSMLVPKRAGRNLLVLYVVTQLLGQAYMCARLARSC